MHDYSVPHRAGAPDTGQIYVPARTLRFDTAG